MMRARATIAWIGCTLLIMLPILVGCGQSPPAPSQPAGATETPRSMTEREVSFSTGDGVELSGTLLTGSPVAIIFSHMSDGDRTDWAGVPRRFAEMGYTTLAFDFRGRGKSGGAFEPATAPADVQAAITFARKEGANTIVLVGASMGAMGSLKAAAAESTQAVVALAGTTSWSGLSVREAELTSIAAPKLFITSEQDPFVDGTLQLFEMSSTPKEKHLYPGGAHGTDLLATHGDNLMQRLTEFISEHAPL